MRDVICCLPCVSLELLLSLSQGVEPKYLVLNCILSHLVEVDLTLRVDLGQDVFKEGVDHSAKDLGVVSAT